MLFSETDTSVMTKFRSLFFGYADPGCDEFLEQFRPDIVYRQINRVLFPVEVFIMAIFIIEALLYWIDDFR